MSPLSQNTVALHGWTAVPCDPSAIFGNKPYLAEPEPLRVDDIHFPSEDPIVEKARQYVLERLPGPTYNHSMRVYYFAAVILRTQFPQHATNLSLSTLALACLFHDIGTTSDHLRQTQLSFEFFGGILALNLLREELGAPLSQAEAVCEAVIRHQDLGSVGTITLLGQLVQLATIHDNMGGHAGLVHPETRRHVCGRFPRNGWSACFARTIREENSLKPWAHTTHLGEEEFPTGVLANQLMKEYE